jgi:hypothetical protein
MNTTPGTFGFGLARGGHTNRAQYDFSSYTDHGGYTPQDGRPKHPQDWTVPQDYKLFLLGAEGWYPWCGATKWTYTPTFSRALGASIGRTWGARVHYPTGELTERKWVGVKIDIDVRNPEHELWVSALLVRSPRPRAFPTRLKYRVMAAVERADGNQEFAGVPDGLGLEPSDYRYATQLPGWSDDSPPLTLLGGFPDEVGGPRFYPKST